MKQRPRFLTFACRGFALVLPLALPMMLPLAVLFGYSVWLVHSGGVVSRAESATSDVRASNAVIVTCVTAEERAGRDGLACIGRFFGPCRKRPDMQSHSEQGECLEREMVLWDRLMNEARQTLLDRLETEAQKASLREAEDLWLKFHHKDCRLPYHFLGQGERSETLGLMCSIDRMARRAIQLRTWRARLGR